MGVAMVEKSTESGEDRPGLLSNLFTGVVESNTNNKDWINSQGRAPLGCCRRTREEVLV